MNFFEAVYGDVFVLSRGVKCYHYQSPNTQWYYLCYHLCRILVDVVCSARQRSRAQPSTPSFYLRSLEQLSSESRASRRIITDASRRNT
jgi:hypothetical protein